MKFDPLGVVGEQRPALKLLGEQRGAELDARVVGNAGRKRSGCRGVKPGTAPRVLVGLDDERAHPRVVGIRVRLEHAVGCLADEELERVERLLDAHPHVPAVPWLQGRGELLVQRAPHPARRAVGADDQVGPAELRQRWCLGREAHIGAQRERAVLQDPEQLASAERRESVSAGPRRLSAEPDVDVGPPGEALGDGGVGLGVGVLEHRERLVGEDDAEAERVARPIALVDDDLRVRRDLAHEDREVQPSGPPTDDRNTHDSLRRPGR